jgi:choline dehydrogenase-like flavoprotein
MANLMPAKQSADVVVIGCGAGGGVITKELAEAGLSVVVLEAGKRYQPDSDYLTDQPDFPVHNTFAPDPRRDLYTWAGAVQFRYFRIKGVGGSTLGYLAVTPRFHESDFRTCSEDGVGEDWPLTYDELEPYYCKVEYELGVSGPSDMEANPFEPPRSRPFPMPSHPLNRAGHIFKRAAEKLGWHLVAPAVAIPTREWDGRPACIGAGTCRLGCRIGSKGSIDVTYVRKAEATGRVEIRTESMAREICLGGDGRARSVIYFDASGNEHEITARAIVLAANAVETPRLLLLSRSRRFPDGLCNSSGVVGKYFMEHLAVVASGVVPEPVDPWQGIPAGGIVQDFYATNPRHSFARGWTIEVNHDAHWPLSVARLVPGWGSAHKRRMQELFSHLVHLATVGEQLPDRANEVTLDATVKDCFGLPVPRIKNEPVPNDRAMVEAMSLRLKELLFNSGAEEVWEPEYRRGGSAHYLGTCRMGHDPKSSVVNPWGRTHDVRNLFIGDGSVFVTGAGVNPALTIMALATRTAEGIVEAFRRQDL